MFINLPAEGIRELPGIISPPMSQPRFRVMNRRDTRLQRQSNDNGFLTSHKNTSVFFYCEVEVSCTERYFSACKCF